MMMMMMMGGRCASGRRRGWAAVGAGRQLMRDRQCFRQQLQQQAFRFWRGAAFHALPAMDTHQYFTELDSSEFAEIEHDHHAMGPEVPLSPQPTL